MKHDATIGVLEHSIRDLVGSDRSFANAFGPYHLSVSPSNVLGEREASSKRQGQAILDELVAFIRAKGHYVHQDSNDPTHRWFGVDYPTLHSRGGTFNTSREAYGPYFSIMDSGTVSRVPETAHAIRVLDKHRKKARAYRTSRTWMLMYLQDSNEIFRSTLDATRALNPSIAPFEQCHMTDFAWRIASFPQ